MPKEILDIVDTAIKIGLGSAITGVTAYFVGRSKYKHEKEKFLLEHKLETVESASSNIEDYFRAWSRVIAQTRGIVRHLEDSGKSSSDITESQLNAIKELDKDLVESWSVRDQAVSKLRILSAQEALDALTECATLERELRDQLMFEKKVPNLESIKEYGNKVGEAKKRFHKELAKFYQNISA